MYKFFRREILSVQEMITNASLSKWNSIPRIRYDQISIIFMLTFGLKVLAGSLFASTYLTSFFIPFTDYFISSGFSDPYKYFHEINSTTPFPYPALMLYIMTLPKLLFGWIAPESVFLSLFLSRIPVLIADFSIFLILKSWLNKKFHKRLVWFYWLSPVLFYISYMHGQLDAIPIAILFGSLYFLFKEKFYIAALVFGCALSAKTNVLLIYPFFFLYMLSKNVTWKSLIYFFFISSVSFVLINIPFIWNLQFFETVFFNKEYLKLFNAHVKINNLKVYLMPASLLILFVRGVLLKHYNKDIFLMLLGFSFSIVLLFIPPMQGWFFWLMPFLSYFYIKKNGRSHLIYISISTCYLAYFFIFENSDFLSVFAPLTTQDLTHVNLYNYLKSVGWNVDKGVNLAYTALQTTMLVNCFWIYKEGLESYRKDKIIASPFLIGVGGNSGVGKSTISEALSNVFGSFNTTVLRGDDMHKWCRNHKKWSEFTHLDPRANYLHKEVNFLKTLKSGQKIFRRNYDHSTGEFTAEKLLKSNNLIIYEGLHPFYLPSQRRLYDLKIFLKPSTDLMYHWKILRDRKKRGYSKEKVIESIKKRENDSEKFIDTQTDKAEFIIEAYPTHQIENLGEEQDEVDVYYKLRLSNIVYLEPLLDELNQLESLHISHWYTDDDQQVVILKGLSTAEAIQKAAKNHISGLEDLGVENPEFPDGLFGTLIMILTHFILEKSRI